MQQKMIVLSVSRYDFEDSSSHRQVRGTSVITASVNPSATGADALGSKPVKTTLDYAAFDRFAGASLPAFADVTLEIDLSSMKAVPVDFSNFQPLAELTE